MAALAERRQQLLEADVMAQQRTTFQHRNSSRQQGFTLLETMISMVVLTIGLVALLGVVGVAMSATQTSQEDMIAKKLAQETVESIYTARDTANITWSQIQNVGGTGIFVTGLQPINQAGADGIFGTADDALAAPQVLTLPGPDGIYGTADDVTVPLTNFKRSIVINTSVPNPNTPGLPYTNLSQLTVTIQYYTPQFYLPKQYVLTSYISQYR
jgi:prepilin-type N-terminal cleavage/methylation domain-containing protein